MTENLEQMQIEIADTSIENKLYDKFSGVLFGCSIADALGWTTEFIKSKEQLRKIYGTDCVTDFRTWEKRTGGRFNTYIDIVQPGEYSDDTQLMLCTARSLYPDGSCNMDHFSKLELPLWLDYSRGAGRTITIAAKAIQRKSATWNNNFFQIKRGEDVVDYRHAGANGAAMRIAPIVLANGDQFNKIYNEIWKNTIVTHGHPRAIIGALLYGKALQLVLHKGLVSAQELLTELMFFTNTAQIPEHDILIMSWLQQWNELNECDFGTVFRDTLDETKSSLLLISRSLNSKIHDIVESLGCFNRSTKGSGTGTALAAIAVYCKYGDSYEKSITQAVNMLGADTDTIGLMVGGLVGARSGYNSIPDRWVTKLQDFSYFLRVAKSLIKIHLGKSNGMDLLPSKANQSTAIPDITEIIHNNRIDEIRNGNLVTHTLFGIGYVHGITAGWIRKRGQATMTLVHVIFDIGQSCLFKVYSSSK